MLQLPSLAFAPSKGFIRASLAIVAAAPEDAVGPLANHNPLPPFECAYQLPVGDASHP